MTSEDAPEVVVTGVRASYERRVLTDVSFTVAPGTTAVLAGPPGCGKTTLVRILLGRARPDRGDVTVGGRSVVTATPDELGEVHHRTRVLFSGLSTGAAGRKGFTGGADDPDDGVAARATVGENVAAAGSAADAGRTRECLEAFDLVDDEHRPAGELGAGARRRLGLARVFVTDPALVVLDDPVAALDPGDRDAVVTALQRVRATSGATIVLTCYDLATMKALGDHVVALVAGRVRAQGPGSTLLRLIATDDDYAVHFAMGGKLRDRSTSSLAEHRSLLRFRGNDQGVLLGCIAIVGVLCLLAILAVMATTRWII